jgi:hypothetical protein
LRHLVIVGNNHELGKTPLSAPATDKLCNQSYSLPREQVGALSPPATVTIRCAYERLYGVDDWVAFYCDPKDCQSDSTEEAAMASIANDPDVLSLAGANSGAVQPSGPYSVDIEVTYE